MAKSGLMALVWGSALVASAGLRWWGSLRPDPLAASWPVVLLIVFSPAVVMGCWLLLVPAPTQTGETRELHDCDQETR